MLSFGGESEMAGGYKSVSRVRGTTTMTNMDFLLTVVTQLGLHPTLEMSMHVAKLILAPSGDEILLVRSQEP